MSKIRRGQHYKLATNQTVLRYAVQICVLLVRGVDGHVEVSSVAHRIPVCIQAVVGDDSRTSS